MQDAQLNKQHFILGTSHAGQTKSDIVFDTDEQVMRQVNWFQTYMIWSRKRFHYITRNIFVSYKFTTAF